MMLDKYKSSTVIKSFCDLNCIRSIHDLMSEQEKM